MARIRIDGTNGADRIDQGNRAFLDIFAKDGNDVINLNRSDDLGGSNFVDAGKGDDGVVNAFEGGNDIRLGDGDDTYVGQGFAFSGSAFDTIRAGAGNDTIAVSTFHSDYFGDSGNDSFFSEGWQNLFNGGSGSDTISYEPRDDSSTLGGTGVGIDLGQGFAQTGANRFETLVSIENAAGTNVGDTILGSNGVNTLNGRGGNDILSGLGGNDRLIGGTGRDELHGDGGADKFDFNNKNESVTGANRDVIIDFSRSQGDKVDLATIDANSTAAANQAFSFIGSAGFSGHAGELRFSNGIISGDIDGNGTSDFHIQINVTSMNAADFIL
ncbi:calcium-binding protein [Rhizobium herbae]|uniref:Serralysin n=1 Tax=Rhizobium herbae TaxID=508661 RepID=A0ABS4ENE5_9HYPH|nr:calcium-binding protein [Rhizobium herbae]MBP1859479.1 serralysin [Rhizobium herbae]